MARGKIYIPIGVPGCGKSTFGSQLVEDGAITPDSIVCPDSFRELLTGDRTNQKCNKLVFFLIGEVISSRLEHGVDIYLDATNLTSKDRDEIVFEALDHDYSVQIIVFDLDEEKVRAQNSSRTHPVPDFAMERMFDRFRNLDLSNYQKYDLVKIVKFHMAPI